MSDRIAENLKYYSPENPGPADNYNLLTLAVIADSNRNRFGNGRIGWKQAGVLAGGAVMLMACQAAAATQRPENQVAATATSEAAITSTSTAVVLENDNVQEVFTLTPSAPPTIIDQESIVGIVESRVRNPDYLSAIGGETGEGEESARLSPLARTTLDAYAFVPVLGPEGQTGYVEKSNYHLVPMAEISSEDGDKLLLTTDSNESWYVYKSSDGKVVRYMPKQVSCRGECVMAVSYNENAPGVTQIFDFDPETGEILGVAQAFYTSDEDDVKFGEFEEDKWDTEVSGANAIVIGISNGVQGLTYDLDTDSIVFQIDNGTTNVMSEPVPLDQFKNSSDLGFYVDSEDGVYVWTETGFVKASENTTPDGAERFGTGDKNFVRMDGVMTWIDSFEEQNGAMTIVIGGDKYEWGTDGWEKQVLSPAQLWAERPITEYKWCTDPLKFEECEVPFSDLQEQSRFAQSKLTEDMFDKSKFAPVSDYRIVDGHLIPSPFDNPPHFTVDGSAPFLKDFMYGQTVINGEEHYVIQVPYFVEGVPANEWPVITGVCPVGPGGYKQYNMEVFRDKMNLVPWDMVDISIATKFINPDTGKNFTRAEVQTIIGEMKEDNFANAHGLVLKFKIADNDSGWYE